MTPAWLVSTIRTTQTVKDISPRLRAFPQNSLSHISLLVAHWGCDFIMLAYYWFLYWLIHIVSFHLWNNQAGLLSLCYGLRKCGIERLWVVPYHWVNSMSQLKKNSILLDVHVFTHFINTPSSFSLWQSTGHTKVNVSALDLGKNLMVTWGNRSQRRGLQE